VEARLDLAGHRAALRDGEPCPLCGACEHPFALTELGDGLRSDARARVDGLESELEQVRSAFLQASTRRAAAEQRVQEQQGRLSALTGQLAQLHARHVALGGEGSPTDARAQMALDALAQETEAGKRALDDRERAHLQAHTALEQARAKLESQKAIREGLRAEEGQLQAEIERARTAEATARRDLQRIETELQAARPSLTEILGDPQWEADLRHQRGEGVPGLDGRLHRRERTTDRRPEGP
jgi:exonuclease SbcC